MVDCHFLYRDGRRHQVALLHVVFQVLSVRAGFESHADMLCSLRFAQGFCVEAAWGEREPGE